MKRELIALLAAALAAPALADISVSTYDDLAENFYGSSFHYNGVTYSNVNDQAGVFPDGNVIIPGATLLYNDFPDYGSANNALTFGTTYVVGDNLSLGALSTVTMTLDQVADFASLELAYYENGPWGGIVYHLDAFRNGSLVASDSFSISDLGGRDNIAFATMSVDGAVFDTLQLYATWNGQYTGPRGLVDNLTLNTVPAPGALALLGLGGLAGRRRR